jgi:hypothetical protein
MVRNAANRESIDHNTSRSICDAVGERLQQNLSPQFLGPAPELDRLLDEFRRRERESGNNRPGSSSGNRSENRLEKRPGPPGRRYGFFF